MTTKKRKDEVRYRKRDYGAEREFIAELVRLEKRADKLELARTVRALHEAIEAARRECAQP